jgi:hypothetical protein
MVGERKDGDQIPKMNDDSDDRRRLRIKMREHLSSVVCNRDSIAKINSDAFDIALRRQNELFEKTTHTREQLIDVTALKEIASAAKVQTNFLDDLSSRCDTTLLLESISKLHGNRTAGTFDWETFGRDVSVHFRSVPSFLVANGPLSQEIKARKQVERKSAKDNEPIVRPDQVANTTKDDDGDDGEDGAAESTNKRVQHLRKLLESKPVTTEVAGEEHVTQTDLLTLLVDPKDPIQTVENFFDFAFLIKDKCANVKLDSSGLPCVAATHFRDSNALSAGIKRQMILSLNMKELNELGGLVQQLLEAERKEECPLHRSDHVYSFTDVQEQAEYLVQQDNAKLNKSPVPKGAQKQKQKQREKRGTPHSDGDSDSSEILPKKSRGKKQKVLNSISNSQD